MSKKKQQTLELPQMKSSEVQLVLQEIKYCNSTKIRVTQEEFILVLESGNTVIAQAAFSLAHARKVTRCDGWGNRCT